MASMERMSSFRHEGHVFFIYNHTKKTEEDDPKDAILYFYPSIVGTDDQVALVGGIIGLADFCLEFIPQTVPSIIKLSFRNFALLQHEEFIIGLGGSSDIPDTFLVAHMQFVWSTFVLYQGSLSAFRKRVSASNFINELKNVWDHYLPLRQIQEDPLSQSFQALPYVQLNKSQGQLFLHASHIIQRSLSHKGVLSGAIFSKNKVLCTQMSNGLTRQLLLLMSHSQFPCVEANSVLELPGGVRLLHIFVPKSECFELGHRRKKAYVHPKTETEGKHRKLSKQTSNTTQLSFRTPDDVPAHNYFLDDVASSGNSVFSISTTQFKKDDETNHPDNQSSGRRDTNTSMASPTSGDKRHRVTSGTDSEVFLDTLSDVTFDADSQVKLTDIKQVECINSSKKMSQLPIELHKDSSDPRTNAQSDFQVSTETHIEHWIETSESHNSKSELGDNLLYSDLSLKSEMICEGQIDIEKTKRDNLLEFSNDINKNQNSINGNAISADSGVNTLLNFAIHKNSNQNENISTFDQEHMQSIEVSTHNLYSDIKTSKVSETTDLNICSKLVTEEVNSAIRSGTFSDSVDSFMTSTDSSYIDNVLSSEQQQNKEFQEEKSHSEIQDNIPVYQNGKVSIETDIEINDGTLTCQESKVNRNDIITSQNGEIASKLKNKDSTVCQDSTDTSSSANYKHNSNQIKADNAEKVEKISVITNGHSDMSNLSVSDSKNDGLPLHHTLTSSKLSATNSFNVSEILAQNKQQIDSSLEVRFSGDESSTHSSFEIKHDDHEASTLSLVYREASPTKDRLTFESIDSELSEGGLLSPVSYQLSPVTESSGHLMDDVFQSRSGSDDSARRNSNQNAKIVTDSSSKPVSDHKSKDFPTSLSSEWDQQKPVSDHKSKDLAASSSEWDPQKEGLQEMILYAQGHSDTLLLLLVSRNVKCNKVYISSLWKSCLSHLAELDFQVKVAERHIKDDSENISAHYQYIKYDSFTQNLKGSALLPVTSLANEIIDSSIRMHESFTSMPDLQEITYRSHSASCYSHRSVNMETYFQLGLSRKSAGICPPNDKTFCLDQMARENLVE